MLKLEGASRSVFRGYIKLMSALVKSAKDVKVLRDHNILETTGYMKDEEVAKIFNGMRDLFSKQEAAHVDKVIGDINRYCNGLLKVKFEKFFEHSLKLIVIILLWLVVALSLFGSVYRYPLVFEEQICLSVYYVGAEHISFLLHPYFISSADFISYHVPLLGVAQLPIFKSTKGDADRSGM